MHRRSWDLPFSLDNIQNETYKKPYFLKKYRIIIIYFSHMCNTFETNDRMKERKLTGAKVFDCTYSGLGLTYSNWDQQVRNMTPSNAIEYNKWLIDHPAESMKERILKLLAWKLVDFRVGQIMVAEEHHKDDAVHFHCYVNFIVQDGKFIRSDDLDIFGIHPNIEQLRKKDAWINYIKKEDKDLVEYQEVIDLTSFE